MEGRVHELPPDFYGLVVSRVRGREKKELCVGCTNRLYRAMDIFHLIQKYKPGISVRSGGERHKLRNNSFSSLLVLIQNKCPISNSVERTSLNLASVLRFVQPHI